MQPFWLDPSDPHRMAAAMQFLTRPLRSQLRRRLRRSGGTTRSTRSASGRKAIHRVVTEGISPEQAVDEAIARIKQILSE